MDDYLEKVVDRDDVRFETVVEHLDADEFDRARERSRTIAGGVAVAIREAGRVVLVENEWMDGYGLPGGGVEPGEDWPAAAAREAREETGIAVEVERPWQVHRQFYEHDGRRCGPDHTVFYLASPADGGRIADDPGVEGEVIEDAGWFEAVPERCVAPARVRAVLAGEI